MEIIVHCIINHNYSYFEHTLNLSYADCEDVSLFRVQSDIDHKVLVKGWNWASIKEVYQVTDSGYFLKLDLK